MEEGQAMIEGLGSDVGDFDNASHWQVRKDKRNIQLSAIAAVDNEHGYCFGVHLNFDPSLDAAAIQAEVETNGDQQFENGFVLMMIPLPSGGLSVPGERLTTDAATPAGITNRGLAERGIRSGNSDGHLIGMVGTGLVGAVHRTRRRMPSARLLLRCRGCS